MQPQIDMGQKKRKFKKKKKRKKRRGRRAEGQGAGMHVCTFFIRVFSIESKVYVENKLF